MKHRARRPHDESATAESYAHPSRSGAAVAPGRASGTTHRDSPVSGSSHAPLQRQPAPLADEAHAGWAATTAQWTPTAMRPDVYPAPLQRAADGATEERDATTDGVDAAGPKAASPARANDTGLPDGLKSGMEQATGHSLDQVRVFRDSEKPAAVHAHAYTQDTDIHVGPGQEKHLPHELGHVVQQLDGRVAANRSINGTPVNDDPALESEATRLGNEALQHQGMDAAPALARTDAGGGPDAPASPSGGAVQREPDPKASRTRLLAIIAQLRELTNNAHTLEGEDEVAPGLQQLKTQLATLDEIAASDDAAAHGEALDALLAEIPGGDVAALEARPVAESKPRETKPANGDGAVTQQQSAAPVQRMGKWGLAGLVVGGIIGIGAVVGGVRYFINRRKERQIFEEFGNSHRDPDFDPDQVGQPGGIHVAPPEDARPEDAPAINEFRQRFHKLHSAKLYLEQRHAHLTQGFVEAHGDLLDNQPSIQARMFAIADGVKAESKAHKKRVKDLGTTTTADELEQQYTDAIHGFGNAALALANAIRAYINEQSDDDKNLDQIHADGTDIWRDTWHRAIMAVNTVLHGRWPHWQGQLRAWVQEKRDDPDADAAYMDPAQVLGLDYIGSLAKGYKGPPKQAVRFMPEKFDVDANLSAPPLAAYALSVGGAIIDRGRIWSRNAGPGLYPGVLQDMEADIQEHLEAAGLIEMGMDPEEPFEVVVDAEGVENLANAPADAVDKKTLSEDDQRVRDKLHSLRRTAPERMQRVGAALTERGYTAMVNGQSLLREHDEENQAYAFTGEELDEIEEIIDTTA